MQVVCVLYVYCMYICENEHWNYKTVNNLLTLAMSLTGVVCETKNGDRKMPLLSEVFDAFPNTPINVDIKYKSDQLIEKVCLITKTCLYNII